MRKMDRKFVRNKYQCDAEEDIELQQRVGSCKNAKCTQIADFLNDKFHNGAQIRTARVVRERYKNYINPFIKKDDCEVREDIILLKKQKESGNKWTKLTKHLKGRTENQVRNRWNSLVNRGAKLFPGRDRNTVIVLLIEMLCEEIGGGNVILQDRILEAQEDLSQVSEMVTYKKRNTC